MSEAPKYEDSGYKISATMIAKGYNQTSLSKAVGVSRAAVNGWANGHFRPEGDNLEKLASVLGVSTAYIAGHDLTPAVDPAQLVTALTKARAARDELTLAILALERATQKGGQTNGPQVNQPLPVEQVSRSLLIDPAGAFGTRGRGSMVYNASSNGILP